MRILLSMLLMLLIPTQGFCVTQWNKAIPAAGDTKSAWPAAVTAQWSIMDTLVSNYRRGESLIYKNSTTLTVTTGEVSNSGGSLRLFLKDTGNTDITTANLDTGASFSAGTQYYVYAGTSSSTASSSTYYISLSSSAPTGPTYYASIGSFITDGSGNIVSQKVYSTNYGPVNSDSNGQPGVQAVFNYSTSSSSYTLKTGGLLVAYGSVSVGASSSATITNLPFTSSTTYSCSASQAGGTVANEGPGCTVGSGSSLTIYNNWPSGSLTINWIATGY